MYPDVRLIVTLGLKTWPSNAGSVSLIPGQGATIPHSKIPQYYVLLFGCQKPKSQRIKWKQYYNELNKDWKMVHIKKKKMTDSNFWPHNN